MVPVIVNIAQLLASEPVGTHVPACAKPASRNKKIKILVFIKFVSPMYNSTRLSGYP